MSTTYTLNPSAFGVFDRAASLLFRAESGELGEVVLAPFIQTAYEAALVLCPQLEASPFPKAHSFQRRRIVALASQLWLKSQEATA